MNNRKQLGTTDIFLPKFSFGTSTFGNMYGNIELDEMKIMVNKAIDNGIVLFDTSPYYGLTLSEINLGKSLKNIPRNKYIISTKVGRYGDNKFDFSSERIISSVNESMERLNIDYIDILLAHDVEYGDIDQIINETIPAMNKLKLEGKVRYIGFSCYPIKLYKKIIDRLKVDIDVILSYGHCCLVNNKLESIIPYLKNKGIGIINASPLCMGLISSNNPPEWHPATPEMKKIIKNIAKNIKHKYNIPIERIALEYALRNNNISTTLTGISSINELNILIDAMNNPLHNYDNIIENINNSIKSIFNIELEE